MESYATCFVQVLQNFPTYQDSLFIPVILVVFPIIPTPYYYNYINKY